MAAYGLDRVIIGVSDLKESLAFYRDWFGMQVVARGDIEPLSVQRLYHLPPETRVRAAFLKNQPVSTLVMLIEFSPPIGSPIRGPRSLDYGIYDLAFRLRGLDKLYHDLTTHGFPVIAPPLAYQPKWSPYPVQDAILIGPDNVHISLIERMTSDEAEAEGFRQLIDTAQIVDDMDAAIGFYCDILGLDLMNQQDLPAGLINDILGLAPEVEARIAFINKRNQDTLSLEILWFSVPGGSLAAAARPPNIGLLRYAFEVDNLGELLATIRAAAIEVVTEPVAVNDTIYGAIKAAVIMAPGGAPIQLFEKSD